MENKYLTVLRKVAVDFLKDEKVKIILFGSRSRKDNFPASDVDIGIIPLERIDERKLILLREKIEELNIPYKVDIVNFDDVSSDFKKEAQKDAVLWKD